MALLTRSAFVLDQAYAEHVTSELLPRLNFTRLGRSETVASLFDTVDWQLWHAGLALLAEQGRLSLWPLDGDGPAPSQRLPLAGLYDAASLPAGTLRRRLEKQIGAAALLPIADIHSTAERYIHRNRAGKIQCRAELVEASVDGLKPLPPLLVAEPLRGYADACRPLFAEFAGTLAAAPPPAERLRVWLRAAGRWPDDTAGPSAELAEELSGDMPAARAIALCLRRALATIQDRAPLAIAGRDQEDLHQFRVAVRQARGLLKALGGLLPAKVAARGKKGLRCLGRLSAPVRDLDVLLASEAKGFAPGLQEALQAKRAADRARLAEALRSARYRRFVLKWAAGLRAVEEDDDGDNLTLREVADAALLQAAASFVGDARGIGPDSSPEDLHALRKEGKQLRYLLDFFHHLYPKRAVKALISDLKASQEGLGDYQDLTAHRELLEEFAEARPFIAVLAAQEPPRRAAAIAALAWCREPAALARYRRLTLSGSEAAPETVAAEREAVGD